MCCGYIVYLYVVGVTTRPLVKSRKRENIIDLGLEEREREKEMDLQRELLRFLGRNQDSDDEESQDERPLLEEDEMVEDMPGSSDEEEELEENES